MQRESHLVDCPVLHAVVLCKGVHPQCIKLIHLFREILWELFGGTLACPEIQIQVIMFRNLACVVV